MKDDYNADEDSRACSCHQKLLFNCRREDLGLHDVKSCPSGSCTATVSTSALLASGLGEAGKGPRLWQAFSGFLWTSQSSLEPRLFPPWESQEVRSTTAGGG